MDVEVDGANALIRGQRHVLQLTIEEPANASFEVEQLEAASKENSKEGILKRLTFRLPAASESKARVRMQVVAS
jgi:hypothetical protein